MMSGFEIISYVIYFSIIILFYYIFYKATEGFSLPIRISVTIIGCIVVAVILLFINLIVGISFYQSDIQDQTTSSPSPSPSSS